MKMQRYIGLAYRYSLLGIMGIILFLFHLTVTGQSLTVTNKLRFWVKADVGVVTNTSKYISQWKDQSGKGLHLNQTVSTNRPKYVLNQSLLGGKPAVRFDGVNDYLLTGTTSWGSSDFTMITVTRKWGTAKKYHHLLSRSLNMNTNGSKYFQIYSSNGVKSVTVNLNKSSARANSTLSMDTNQFHIITVTRKNKISKGTRIHVDGNLEAQSSGTATTNSLSASNYHFYVGGWNTARAKSLIAEMLVYDRTLSTNEIAKVESYLQAKYKLGTVPPPSGLSAEGFMGYYHSIYLKSDHHLYFTGDDSSGNRGNGSGNSSTSSLKAVSGMTSVSSVTCGSEHTLALKMDGTLWGWGNNAGMQINASSSTQVDSPVKITTLSGITDISGGELHSVALKSDGTVWSWGYNYFGTLGNNTYNDSGNPVKAYNLTGVTDVEAGAYSSYAVKSNGTLWGWGDKSFGELGDGTSNAGGVKAPKQIASGVSKVSSSGYHVLILKTDGTVWVTGDNSFGQIGDGTTVQKNSFTKVPNLTGVTQIAAGWDTSFALKSDGTVWAWGNNTSGNLGLGDTSQRNSPTKITSLSSIVHIEAGGFGATATKSDGKVYGWGGNTKGQIGDGTTTMRKSPVLVSIP